MTTHTLSYPMTTLLAKQVLDKYNTQHARFPVEYIEITLDPDTDVRLVGPKDAVTYTGDSMRSMWVRFEDSGMMHRLVYIRVRSMHRDICRIDFVYDDAMSASAPYEG